MECLEAEELMQLDVDFISKVLKNAQIENGPFPHDVSFSVDTRTIQENSVFVALQGIRVDGHDFIQEALHKGAVGFIVSIHKKSELLKKFGTQLSSKHILFVQDTLQALLDLAKSWRDQFTYPVIGITGSVGKTTTKEMVRNILKLTDMKHIVSFGNQNTLIGVSLNMLNMRSYHQVAIFEMGISKQGDMKKLAALVRPTFALIVKVGHGHMKGLGDFSSVASEKRNIFSCFSDRSIGIINGDQPELSSISYTHPVIRFGLKTTNQIQARKVVVANNTVSFVAKIYNQKYSVMIPGCHQGRVINALAAMTIGYLLQIPNEILVKGVEQPIVVGGRFQILEHRSGSVLINDAYNSNPDSAKMSLLAFEQYETNKQKVVVLGDMKELGVDSEFWHRQLGRFLHKIPNVHYVILIGKHVRATQQTLPLLLKSKIFDSIEDSFDFLKSMLLEKNKVFLFKGSNSLRLSELVDKLQEVN